MVHVEAIGRKHREITWKRTFDLVEATNPYKTLLAGLSSFRELFISFSSLPRYGCR